MIPPCSTLTRQEEWACPWSEEASHLKMPASSGKMFMIVSRAVFPSKNVWKAGLAVMTLEFLHPHLPHMNPGWGFRSPYIRA